MSVYSDIVMTIVIGSDGHKDFVSSVAKNLDDSKVFFYHKTQFKGYSSGDVRIGEHKISFPEELVEELKTDGNVILIVRGKYSKWNSDALFLEMCQLVDTLKSGGPNMKGVKAERLCLVLPREGYGKQDHMFRGEDGNIIYGESLTSSMQRRILKSLGTDLIITVYPHDFRPEGDREGWIKTACSKENPSELLLGNEEIGNREVSIIQDWTGFAWSVTPVKIISDFVKRKNIRIDAVISADKSAYSFSKFIADKLGVECILIESHRSREDATKITCNNEINAKLKGKSVLLPDDMILTGSKIFHAINCLRSDENNSPEEIHIAEIHGEFTGDTYEKLIEKNVKVYCSNTIQNPAEVMDITEILAERINRLFLDG